MLRGMNTSLLEHPVFATDFARLRGVTLDPSRHTLPDAETNGLPAEEAALTWFIDESTRRGLLTRPLVLDA